MSPFLPILALLGGLLLAYPAEVAPEGEQPDPTDSLPAGMVARAGRVPFRCSSTGLSGTGLAAAFAPDGKSVFCGCADGAVSQIEVATGKVQRRLCWEDGCITAVAVTPSVQEPLLLAAAFKSKIRIWDVAAGKVIRELEGRPGWIYHLVFSPDGKVLASSGLDHQLHRWDMATGKELAPLTHSSSLQAIVFAPDGKTVASADNERIIHHWDLTSGKELFRFENSEQAIRMLSFAVDGKTLFAATVPPGVLALDVATGKMRRAFQPGEIDGNPVALAPDGTLLAAYDAEHCLRFWNIAQEKELGKIDVGASARMVLRFSPDGKQVAALIGPRLRVWNVAEGNHRPEWDEDQLAVVSIAFSPDGKLLATADYLHRVRMWDLASNKPLWQSPEGQRWARHLTFTKDSETLIGTICCKTPRFWAVRTGKECRNYSQLNIEDNLWGYPCLGDNTLAAGISANTIRLWDLKALTKRDLDAPPDVKAWSLALSPNSRTLAIVGGGEGILRNAVTGKNLSKFIVPRSRNETKEPHVLDDALVFSPDGRLLAGVGNEEAPLWIYETASGKEVARLKAAQEVFLSLSFSRDGRYLAFMPAFEPSVRVWDLATEKEVLVLPTWRGCGAFAFSPDGKFLAVSMPDSTVGLWDLAVLLRRGPEQPARLSLQELDAIWNELRAEDPSRAYQAVWKLTSRPEQALPLLRVRLQPCRIDLKQINSFLSELDSDQFARREKAMASLAEIADAAEPLMRQKLTEGPSVEVRARLERLLDRLETRQLSPEQLRMTRALAVLEQVATPEAAKILEGLTHGTPKAWLTEEAAATLERVKRR